MKSPREISRDQDIATIRQGGGIYVGWQEGVAGQAPDMYLFIDPETHSTLAIPTGELSIERVQAKLAEVRARTQGPGAQAST